jgi:hypothetical protein
MNMLAYRLAMKSSFIFLIILLALPARAHAKTITADELHSDLRSALSLASETELFIDQIESGRLLPHFRLGHADNLLEEAQRQAKELRESHVAEDEKNLLALCSEQLDLLARELQSVGGGSVKERIAETREQVDTIRKTLLAAGACR